MILVRSAAFNAFFFASTFLVTLAATGVRLLAPHRVIVVVVAGRACSCGPRARSAAYAGR